MSTKEVNFAIRFDLIMLVLVALKLQALIELSWLTINLMLIIPMIIGHFIKRWSLQMKEKVKDLPPGTHKIGIWTVEKK